jgi:hypothetical protein
VVRERFFTPRLRVASYEELNAWLQRTLFIGRIKSFIVEEGDYPAGVSIEHATRALLHFSDADAAE